MADFLICAAAEIAAAGPPKTAIATPIGALPEIIEPGRTGFLAGNVDEIASAMAAASSLSAGDCRDAARRRFSATEMVERYVDLYRALARNGASAARTSLPQIG